MNPQFNPFFSARDMSYCVCSGKNKTRGFSCKQHCKFGKPKSKPKSKTKPKTKSKTKPKTKSKIKSKPKK